MLGLTLNYVGKTGPWTRPCNKQKIFISVIHNTLCNRCKYLPMLGLTLNYVSKTGPWTRPCNKQNIFIRVIHNTLCNRCNYLPMLGLTLNYVRVTTLAGSTLFPHHHTTRSPPPTTTTSRSIFHFILAFSYPANYDHIICVEQWECCGKSIGLKEATLGMLFIHSCSIDAIIIHIVISLFVGYICLVIILLYKYTEQYAIMIKGSRCVFTGIVWSEWFQSRSLK